MKKNKGAYKIPDLTHEAANRLNGICTIAGYLIDIINRTDLSVPLKEDFLKSLKIIESKTQEAALELNKIKDELQSRNQYT